MAITFSETLPQDIDLTKVEDYDSMDEGDPVEWLDVPGHYIMQCMNVKTAEGDDSHKPSENLLLKVTGAEDKDQIGKVHLERLYHTASDRVIKLGKRCGVWSPEQHQEMLDLVNSGEPAAGPDFTPCIGKEFLVEIKAEKYKDKTQCKVGYVGIWQLKHADAVNLVRRIRGGATGGTSAKPGAKVEPAPAANRSTTASNGKAGSKPATPAAKRPAAADVDDL